MDCDRELKCLGRELDLLGLTGSGIGPTRPTGLLGFIHNNVVGQETLQVTED